MVETPQSAPAAAADRTTDMQYDSLRALELLKRGTGWPNARFRKGQEEAIRHLVEGRRRQLLVQKTGWGKSFVYFITTRLLREAGLGPTLLVSPLLALMRNQIAAADVVDSRWTFTVAAWELRRRGCGPVLPLALANAGGGS
jgi:superfamily II DNA helicase RecQ